MKSKHAEYQRRWREKNPDKWARTLKKCHLKKYGLTPEGYQILLEAQNFKCAICRSADPGPKSWHVDHCHTTSRVRGLLCHYCNTALGGFKDDPAILQAAIRYLSC